MTIQIKVTGDKEIMKKLEELANLGDDAIKDAVLKGAIHVEGEAKERTPVKTGRLRASITHEVFSSGADHEGRIGPGNDVEYGIHVEFGTVNQRAQPYLRPGLQESRDKILDILKNAIKRLRP